MHQVLGIDVAARERAGVAAESRKLAEDVEGGRALKRHDPYTELEAELIRQGFKPHTLQAGSVAIISNGLGPEAGAPGSPLQFIQCDRQVAHALADRVIDRVGDCRRDADDSKSRPAP